MTARRGQPGLVPDLTALTCTRRAPQPAWPSRATTRCRRNASTSPERWSAAVVGVVGTRHRRQLTEGEEPGCGLGPRHGHDRLSAGPGDQHRHPDQQQLALDRVAQGLGQGPGDPVRPGVADVAQQDGSCVGSSRAVARSQRRICREAVRADGSMVGPIRTRPRTRSGWRTARSTATWQPKELPTTVAGGNPLSSVQAARWSACSARSSTRPGSPLGPKPARSITWTGWWPASLAASGIM